MDSLFGYCEPEPNSGCWIWMSDRSNKNYGLLSANGVMSLAHRVVYRLAWGDIPAGHVVMHRCDNPPCINPTHLTTGTRSDNAQDSIRKGRNAIITGERNASAKLTAAQVVMIRSRLGLDSQYALAREFAVTRSNIYRIAKGLTWRS